MHTPRGNVTKDVNIVVMSEDTIYCPAKVSVTNKGTFRWSKIVSGVRVDLACPSGPSSTYAGNKPPHAFYTCDKSGSWKELDTSQCQFESEVTRVLEQYAKVCHLGRFIIDTVNVEISVQYIFLLFRAGSWMCKNLT